MGRTTRIRTVLAAAALVVTGCQGSLGGGTSGGSGDGECAPFASRICNNNNLHWVDSCGDLGERIEECGALAECRIDFSTCCDIGAPVGSCHLPTGEPRPARCDDEMSDVPASHQAHDDVHSLYVNEVVDGCSSNPLAFCPDDALLRRHVAMMLVRAAGDIPSTAATNAYFCDIDGEAAPYINRLFELGITEGCATPCADPNKKSYCPDEAVRRDHMAIFLVRALGQSESTAAPNAYFDDLEGGHSSYVNRLFELGITDGCGARSYCPIEPTIRWQSATFFARAFNMTSTVCTAQAQ